MVGQTKLLQKLDSYTIDTLPRTILLVGERGSGKHLASDHVAKDILHIDKLDITETISDELLDQIYNNPTPMLYEVDLSQLMEKQQNILLKFIEEPTTTAFVILLCENKNLALDTVLNRCMIFEMDPYSNEELDSFIPGGANKKLLLQVLHTPGQLLTCTHCNWEALADLCNKIADKINIANYSNTLSISRKINYKDEYDKFDLDIFLNFLSFTLFNKYLNENNENILNMYLSLVESRKKLADKRLNKQIWVENMLTQLWKVSRNGH